MLEQIEFKKVLVSALGEFGAPVFAASYDSPKSLLTLHARAGCDAKKLKSQIQVALERAGERVAVSVRVHRLRHLAHPRSLEHWQKRFEAGDVLYDPTMIVSRARGLVLAARSCRSALAETIGGLFFDPDRRSLLVLDTRKSDAAAKSALRSRVTAVVDEAWCRSGGAETQSGINVQVVPVLPRKNLVPIDARSASRVRTIVRAVRRWLSPAAVAFALTGIALPAAAHVQGGRMEPAGKTVPAVADFGLLAGLSVFTDGQLHEELSAFAAAGLQQYFGDRAEVIRLAQAQKKKEEAREASGH